MPLSPNWKYVQIMYALFTKRYLLCANYILKRGKTLNEIQNYKSINIYLSLDFILNLCLDFTQTT